MWTQEFKFIYQIHIDFLRDTKWLITLLSFKCTNRYFEELESMSLHNDIAEVAGMDIGLKYKLFQESLQHDTIYVGLAGVLIFMFIWMYSASLFVTFMTFCAVIFSVGMAYFMYTIVYQIKFFPFINILTFVIIIGKIFHCLIFFSLLVF